MSCPKFRFEAHVTTAPHFDDLNQKALPFREWVRPLLVIDVLIARFLPRRQTRISINDKFDLPVVIYRLPRDSSSISEKVKLASCMHLAEISNNGFT